MSELLRHTDATKIIVDLSNTTIFPIFDTSKGIRALRIQDFETIRLSKFIMKILDYRKIKYEIMKSSFPISESP